MKEISISVTEAGRNFSDYVNQAHEGQSFVMLKNGVAFARLIPAAKRTCRGKDLAEALAALTLSAAAARAWQRDLKAARKKLKAPRGKWQQD